MNNRKIKICYVASADITLKFLLLNHIKFLKDKGYKVSAVCSPGKWVEDLRSRGIEVKTIKMKRKITPFFDIISFFMLLSYFKKEKFDIIHTFTPKPGLLGQISARLAGAPVIFNTIFGFYFSPDSSYFKKSFFALIEKIAAKFSDRIFFRNKEDFNTAKEKKIGNGRKNIYMEDGINILHFYPEKFSQNFIKEKKKKLRINLKAPVVGILARLVAEKGYLELFSAFKKVLEKFPSAILLSVGSGDKEKKDSIDPAIVKDFGIENNVMFLGERTDVDEIYSVIDVFVLPSWREGFSHSLMEASAMAKPTVATDIRGCREIVEHDKTGLLVPPKNAEKLAEAIIYLLSNSDKAAQMGFEARKKAEVEFDERNIFEKTEKVYMALIKEKLL